MRKEVTRRVLYRTERMIHYFFRLLSHEGTLSTHVENGHTVTGGVVGGAGGGGA